MVAPNTKDDMEDGVNGVMVPGRMKTEMLMW